MGQIGTLNIFAPNTVIKSAYMNANFSDIKNAYNAHDSSTSQHGVTGNVVGTEGAQTVVSKTFGRCPIAQELMAGSATTTAFKNTIMAAAGITVSLETTECVNGNRITVTDYTSGAGSSNITINGEGGELINGVASAYIVEDGGSITFEAYSSNWYII